MHVKTYKHETYFSLYQYSWVLAPIWKYTSLWDIFKREASRLPDLNERIVHGATVDRNLDRIFLTRYINSLFHYQDHNLL